VPISAIVLSVGLYQWACWSF